MQLSQESYRARWLILVAAWTLVATALTLHTRLVDEYLETVGKLGLRGAPLASTPLKQAFPAFAADAQMWVRHALALVEGDKLQLRFTTIDNAPYGREVHWNSAWAWTIAGAGWLHHQFTGQPLTLSMERATLWLNPAVLFALIVTLSAWTTKRAGAIAGVVLVVAMTCHERIMEGFFPSYVDHHGLLTVAVLGMMLGAVFMGGGWWREETAERARILPGSGHAARYGAAFSAVCGACGLWVSAASVIPAIAITGIAGLLAVLIQGRTAQAQGANFDGDAWRLWGRIGGAASVLFYLLEYFPRHLGIRLEPNHPLHALAWLGGGELIAQLGEWWLSAPQNRPLRWQKLVWPVALICLVPLTIAIGGVKVFSPVLDPFMSRLHNDYIQEFLPMWKTLRSFDAKAIWHVIVLGNIPLMAAIATLTYRGRENPIVIWFVTFAVVLLTAMAWWQTRWTLNASGAQICLILLLLASWTDTLRPLLRWATALAIVGALFVPSAVMRYQGSRADVKAARVAPKDAQSSLNRDIATVLRASQPEGDIVLLSSPNGSVGIGYYGRFKTLGTLYWENSDGLKAAASIFSANTENEAATLIRTHKVTHIAIISDENFIQQYYQLLHPAATVEQIKQSFGFRLFFDRVVPQWLQPLPYKVPDDLSALKVKVMLFKVNFKQTLAEAIYNVALTQISEESLEEADRTLDILVQQAPQFYQPWLRKGELHLLRHNWNEAAEHMLKGISLAPPAERPDLYASTAQAFYNNKQHALAVRIYRIALAEQFTPNLASYLAWVLATSEDDSVRNGKEAIQFAQAALKTDPNSPTYLNALSAALAEQGQFAEAISAGDRSVVNARLRGEALALRVFEERLAIIRSGKPLRK